MSSSADNTVYCCIAKGTKVIYCYSSAKDGGETEATAALCLENAPPYHRHYVHTFGTRSYGYLMADGHTFFAIIDPSVGSVGALQFLDRVREEFIRNNNRNGLHDALVPAVQRLVASLEKMPRVAIVLEDGNRRGGSNESSSCTSSKVPLLGKGGGRKDKKKGKEKGASMGDDDEDEHHGTRGVRIDVPPEDVSGMSLERSTSQSRLRRQQSSRSLWMRHVKIIIIVDAVICVILFAAWLAVCKGFQCVSG
ncbi:hypothetical protein BRADI_3g13440v3 [Brachypodium distachyon]|nr:hypothetical protein BRADI_3g13440v3 [Brachypodium distachyon]PNT66514.1 hypothetical protein BRADI_3g13440v3 [Brachypodium distachyon]